MQPILQVLPFVPMQEILRHLDHIDLLNFSTLSRRTKGLARSIHVRFDQCNCSFNGMFISFFNDSNPDYSLITLEVNSFLEPDHPQPRSFYIEIENPTEENRIVALQKMARHCWEVFGQPRSVHANFKSSHDIRNMLLWTYCNQLKQLEVRSHYENDPPVSIDSMNFIMDDLQPTDFILSAPVETGYRYSQNLTNERMDIMSTDWLQFDSILNMECKILQIDDIALSILQWKQIVLKWCNGGLENLVHISTKGEFLQFIKIYIECTVIMDDRAISFDINEDTKRLRREPDLMGGFDVRSIDGKTAVLCFTIEELKFIVWNQQANEDEG